MIIESINPNYVSRPSNDDQEYDTLCAQRMADLIKEYKSEYFPHILENQKPDLITILEEQEKEIQEPELGKPLPKSGRCQVRGWSLVYNTEMSCEDILKGLGKVKYGGLFSAFAVAHKPNDPETTDKVKHVHVGLFLRKVPKDLYYDAQKIKEVFKVPNPLLEDYIYPVAHDKLLKTRGSVCAKLSQLYDYCKNQEIHPEEDISEEAHFRFTPLTEMDTSKPHEYLHKKIIEEYLTVDDLEDLIESRETPTKLAAYALKKFDELEKMINKLSDIRAARRNREKYKIVKETYRDFQEANSKILDNQNDREIHNHVDNGNTGKSLFMKNEGRRRDIVIITSTKPSTIASIWNHRKHKRIIFNFTRGNAKNIPFRAIEALKDGVIAKDKYRTKMKVSDFNPSIVILSNEPIERYVEWTHDRLTVSHTTEESNYQFIEGYPEMTFLNE